MTTPILHNHDAARPIGKVSTENGAMVVEMLPEHALSEPQFFAIFGDPGFRVLDFEMRNGVRFIRRAEILEWSIGVLPPEGK